MPLTRFLPKPRPRCSPHSTLPKKIVGIRLSNVDNFLQIAHFVYIYKYSLWEIYGTASAQNASILFKDIAVRRNLDNIWEMFFFTQKCEIWFANKSGIHKAAFSLWAPANNTSIEVGGMQEVSAFRVWRCVCHGVFGGSFLGNRFASYVLLCYMYNLRYIFFPC